MPDDGQDVPSAKLLVAWFVVRRSILDLPLRSTSFIALIADVFREVTTRGEQ